MAITSIHDVLVQFREAASSNRDLGDRFERLICRYLELDPFYAERFSNVWMWNEWPRKGNVGDVGIDVVAEERATGEFCAVQCKFFLPEHTIAKEDIDSFFTASGKELFTSCMIVSTTDRWSKNAEHALANQSKPVNRLTVHDLDASPIDWSKFSLQRPQDLSLRERKKTLEHQTTAITDVVKGFAQADRGKLIMACGTGKTFTALRIAEQVAPKGHILFLVPSLSLLSQSLREWTAESARPIHSLAVCSDTNIGKRATKTDDDKTDITTYDLAFPATTCARQIVGQYQAIHRMAEKKKSAAQVTVVFSTYQSIEAVAEAQKAGLPEFDLIICDEAHRTTGVTLSGEDDSQSDGDGQMKAREVQGAFACPHLEEWKDAIDARIVQKCGERGYWEVWAKDVAVIAERHTTRIRALLENGEPHHKKAFADFLAGLRDNLNPSFTEDDAIEMLSQHLTVDKDSGLRNDPNDWARQHNQPRYILDLLKRIVRVSLETMKIVNALPALNERK